MDTGHRASCRRAERFLDFSLGFPLFDYTVYLDIAEDLFISKSTIIFGTNSLLSRRSKWQSTPSFLEPLALFLEDFYNVRKVDTHIHHSAATWRVSCAL